MPTTDGQGRVMSLSEALRMAKEQGQIKGKETGGKEDIYSITNNLTGNSSDKLLPLSISLAFFLSSSDA